MSCTRPRRSCIVLLAVWVLTCTCTSQRTIEEELPMQETDILFLCVLTKLGILPIDTPQLTKTVDDTVWRATAIKSLALDYDAVQLLNIAVALKTFIIRQEGQDWIFEGESFSERRYSRRIADSTVELACKKIRRSKSMEKGKG